MRLLTPASISFLSCGVSGHGYREARNLETWTQCQKLQINTKKDIGTQNMRWTHKLQVNTYNDTLTHNLHTNKQTNNNPGCKQKKQMAHQVTPTPHRSSSPCSSAGPLGKRWWTPICELGPPVIKTTSHMNRLLVRFKLSTEIDHGISEHFRWSVQREYDK